MSSGMISQPISGSGTMAIATSRQVADSQVQMIAAKSYPRDEDAALARILKACHRKALAEEATYSFKKGDGVVEGASIRMAEVLATSWGNMTFGFTVLDSNAEESQVQAFAWDLETNTQRQQVFPVKHVRVTGSGDKQKTKHLTDPRDIYEAVANSAARRVRACILALIPGDVQDTALAACAATMNQVTGKELPERIADMVTRFGEMGITQTMIEARLQTPRAAWTAQQVVVMGKLFVSLRDGFVRQADIPEFADPDIVPVSQSRHPAGLPAIERVKASHDRVVKMLSKDPEASATFQDIWKAMSAAKNETGLEAAWNEWLGSVNGFGSDVQKILGLYKNELRADFGKVEAAS